MSISVGIDGASVLVGIPPPSIVSTQLADMGQAAFGSFTIEDDAATETLTGFRPVTIAETDCSQPRLFTGYIHQRDVSRDPPNAEIVGAARIFDTTIVDCNAAARFRLISGADGNRPEETWEERFDWILNSDYLAGLVSTSRTFTDSWPNPMDACDFRGSFAGDVLDDLAHRFEGAVNWFFFWDPDALAVTCFMDHIDQGIATSTLRISNVESDIDSTITFAPDSVASLAREPDQTYSEVRVDYANGSVFRSRESTATTYIRRGTTISRPYTGKETTAQAQAEQFLTAHASEVDRITCSIQVPSASVGLIQAGQLISCRFSHMPGYETFTTLRIVMCSPVPTNDVADFYTVALELVGPKPEQEGVPLAFSLLRHHSGFYGCTPREYLEGGSGTGDPELVGWNDQGDYPPAGFVHEYSEGPVEPIPYQVATACLFRGVRVLADAVVDIALQGGFLGVAGDPAAEITVQIRQNGTVISTQTKVDPAPGGLHGWGGTFTFALTDIVAEANDEFEVSVIFSESWAGFEYFATIPGENNSHTHFRVTGSTGPGWSDDTGTLPPPPPPAPLHTTDPTVDDDSDAGYHTGSPWLNSSTGEMFVLVDETVGAAVWVSTTSTGAIDHGALTGLADDDHTQYVLKRYGGKEVVSTVAASGAAETLDLADGNVHDVTLTADCTFTFAGATNGVACSFTLLLRQDGTGGWTTTWPGSVVWAGGSAPVLDETASTVAVLTFVTLDGGTVWYGFPTGGGGGTPATTVTDETTWGIAPAVGSDTEYARQDHTHGSPAEPAGTGELLITDTPAGSPLIFADILQNEAGTALLYTG